MFVNTLFQLNDNCGIVISEFVVLDCFLLLCYYLCLTMTAKILKIIVP